MTPARIANTAPMRLVCVLVFTAAPAALGQARETLTLDQAIERALRANPQMVQARGDQDIAAAAERTARGNYLPSVSASATTTLGNGAAGTGSAARTGAGAGVSLNYDVFTGFRRGALQAQAQAQTQSTRAALVQNRSSVVLAVEQTFFENLRARELEEVAEARLRRAQEGLDAANRRNAAGTGTRSDVLRGELEVNTARRSLVESRAQRETSAFALGRQIGADGPVDAEADLHSAVADAELDEPRFLSELLQQSPDVIAAEADLRSANAGVAVARSEYYPQLSLGAGYDWASSTGLLFPGYTGWSARLQLSYPIFDGFRRDESATRARVRESVASATAADTRRSVRATAEQLLGLLRLARDQIGLAEDSVAVAEEDLRVQQERYRMGVSTMLELLTSQENVVQAQTDLVAARFDYRLAHSSLLALAGRQP
jgi:outer membrane protein